MKTLQLLVFIYYYIFTLSVMASTVASGSMVFSLWMEHSSKAENFVHLVSTGAVIGQTYWTKHISWP